MNKLNALLLLTFIESAAAADTVVAYSDKLDVLQVLVENAVAVSHHEPNETTALPLLETSKQTRISVAHTRIAALPDSSAGTEKAALAKILLQFNNLKILSARPSQKAAAPAAPSEPAIAAPQPQEGITVPTGEIDLKTLEELTAAAKDPNTIAEPLALAQTLYRAGHFKEAALFYEIAAGRTTAMGRSLTSDDKAWILLQLAECHHDSPATVIAILDKLIAEHPKSIWTSAATAKRDILQWYQKDNPRQLLETAQ
jgi:hypothetical protein